VLLAAGLDGIKNKIDPGEPVERNIYDLSYDERKERSIVSLPESLKEVLDELESSDLLCEILRQTALTQWVQGVAILLLVEVIDLGVLSVNGFDPILGLIPPNPLSNH
jgi:hypothetical protein